MAYEENQYIHKCNLKVELTGILSVSSSLVPERLFSRGFSPLNVFASRHHSADIAFSREIRVVVYYGDRL